MRVAPQTVVTDEERDELMRLVRSKLTSVRLVQRACIVLLAADGMQTKDMAQKLGVRREKVSRCREHYAQSRLARRERGDTSPADEKSPGW